MFILTWRTQVKPARAVILLTLVMLLPGTTNAGDVLYVAEIQLRDTGEDWVPILSFEYAEQNQAAGSSGKGFSKVEMTDIVVNRLVDEESSKLFFDCAMGTFWPRANIRVLDGDEFLVIELREVYVTSYMLYGESGPEPPKESFSLHYSKIAYTVYPGENAEISRGWDLLKNQPLF